MYLNAAGAPFDDFAVWRATPVDASAAPASGSSLAASAEPEEALPLEEWLVCGQDRFHGVKEVLSVEAIMKEWHKVKNVIQSEGKKSVAERWLLVIRTTAVVSSQLDLAQIPANVVILDANGLEGWLGPFLASTSLRLMLRGRRANANVSREEELALVEGVGRQLAERIVDARGRRGFADWADLRARVPAVSARLESLGMLEF